MLSCIFCLVILLLSRSFVQDQVATSFCETEYVAYSSGVKDVKYIRLLLIDLHIFYEGTVTPTMLVGNKPAITVAQGPSQHSHPKHIDLLLHCAVTMYAVAWYIGWYTLAQTTKLQIYNQAITGEYLLYHGRFMVLLPFLRT